MSTPDRTERIFPSENADRSNQPKRPDGISIGGILGSFKRNLDVTLSRKVVNLFGLRLLDNADQIGRIRHIALMHREPNMLFVPNLVEVINTLGIKRRRATLHPMHDVFLVEQ
jgi:hypothetical protein